MFQVNGAMIYVDPDGQVQGYEDVFTKIDMCQRALRGGRARRGLRGALHPLSSDVPAAKSIFSDRLSNSLFTRGPSPVKSMT